MEHEYDPEVHRANDRRQSAEEHGRLVTRTHSERLLEALSASQNWTCGPTDSPGPTPSLPTSSRRLQNEHAITSSYNIDSEQGKLILIIKTYYLITVLKHTNKESLNAALEHLTKKETNDNVFLSTNLFVRKTPVGIIVEVLELAQFFKIKILFEISNTDQTDIFNKINNFSTNDPGYIFDELLDKIKSNIKKLPNGSTQTPAEYIKNVFLTWLDSELSSEQSITNITQTTANSGNEQVHHCHPEHPRLDSKVKKWIEINSSLHTNYNGQDSLSEFNKKATKHLIPHSFIVLVNTIFINYAFKALSECQARDSPMFGLNEEQNYHYLGIPSIILNDVSVFVVLYRFLSNCREGKFTQFSGAKLLMLIAPVAFAALTYPISVAQATRPNGINKQPEESISSWAWDIFQIVFSYVFRFAMLLDSSFNHKNLPPEQIPKHNKLIKILAIIYSISNANKLAETSEMLGLPDNALYRSIIPVPQLLTITITYQLCVMWMFDIQKFIKAHKTKLNWCVFAICLIGSMMSVASGLGGASRHQSSTTEGSKKSIFDIISLVEGSSIASATKYIILCANTVTIGLINLSIWTRLVVKVMGLYCSPKLEETSAGKKSCSQKLENAKSKLGPVLYFTPGLDPEYTKAYLDMLRSMQCTDPAIENKLRQLYMLLYMIDYSKQRESIMRALSYLETRNPSTTRRCCTRTMLFGKRKPPLSNEGGDQTQSLLESGEAASPEEMSLGEEGKRRLGGQGSSFTAFRST